MPAALPFTVLVWLGSLFGLLGIERFLLDPLPSPTTNTIVFVVQTLPILLCAPVTLRNPARGAFWVSLVSMLYFVDGVVTAFRPADRWQGGLEIAFALGAFVTALLLLRATGPGAKGS